MRFEHLSVAYKYDDDVLRDLSTAAPIMSVYESAGGISKKNGAAVNASSVYGPRVH